MSISYQGFTLDGQAVSGIVEAADRAAAHAYLKTQGIIAVRLEEARNARRRAGHRRVSVDNMATFLRQAAMLIGTGTPLVEALDSIARQTKEVRLRTVINDLRRLVEEGSALSDAMGTMPTVFDPVCRTMVAAGEAAGILERMLGDLAEIYRRQSRLRRAIIGATAYPAVVVTAALIVLVGLIVFVLPRFKSMFDAVQAPVPPTTAALMALGTFVREHWLGVSVVAAGVIAGLVATIIAPGPRKRLANALLTAPIVGRLVRSLMTAQLARCLGILLEAKVGLLDALRLTRDSMGHPAYVDLLRNAENAVSQGESLASVFGDERRVGPSVKQAISSGERAGRLGPVLAQLGRYLDEDNEVAVRGLARTLEPVLLGALGIVIGFVAVSLFLPLFDVAASAGGQA